MSTSIVLLTALIACTLLTIKHRSAPHLARRSNPAAAPTNLIYSDLAKSLNVSASANRETFRSKAGNTVATGLFVCTIDGRDGAGNFFTNVFHYTINDMSGYTDQYQPAVDLVNALDTAISTLYCNCMGTDATMYNITARRADGPGGMTAVKNVNLSGTGGGITVCQGIAANLKLFTADPSNVCGHMYLACIPDGQLIDSSWTVPFTTSVANLFNGFTGTITVGTTTASLVVHNKKLATSYNVTAGALATKPTMMNRRLRPSL